MKSWMLAVLVACNFQLVHKSRSTQIHTSSMFTIPHTMVSGASKSTLSTNCIMSPYSELAKRLLGDSSVTCGGRVNYSYKSGSYNGESWSRFKVGAVVHYFRALRWTPIPLGVGFAYIAYQQFRNTKKREASKISTATCPTDLLASDFQVSLYTMLPLRATSRFWGWINMIDLPTIIRKPLLNMFINSYGCNVQEAMVEDLNYYHNLGEFFRRSLKPEVRPIYPGSNVVSPSDGTVLHFGRIENGLVEQVKGITYSLKSFLGLPKDKDASVSDNEYEQRLLKNKDNALYHCVVYLAPGDYHKFHSPASWTVKSRKHFPGALLSVRPGVVNWIAGLFNLNERVVYEGEWNHGFFSMTAVGATNVGSIKVYFDETLETNTKKWTKGHCEKQCFSPGCRFSKGNAFGEFNLGSTVVLVFEAPKHLKFAVERGQKIKYGELLFRCCSDCCEST